VESYIVLEWNQAGGQPCIHGGLHAAFDDARNAARAAVTENRSNGRRETYSVHEVDDDWTWHSDNDGLADAR
jgi:hypothetical protein